MGPKDFLDRRNKVAVVGVSSNPEKWGSRVFKTLVGTGFDAYPVNPKHSEVGGVKCYPDLRSLPEKPDVVITATPPKATEAVVRQCREAGTDKVWMQPGSESKEAIDFCESNGIEAVRDACFVVDGLKKDAGDIVFACKRISQEDLIRCSFNLNKTEYNVLVFLMKSGRETTASGTSSAMGLERTTVQKALKALLEKSLVRRTRRALPKGGYSYLYKVGGKDEIKARMRAAVHEWYEGVKSEIDAL